MVRVHRGVTICTDNPIHHIYKDLYIHPPSVVEVLPSGAPCNDTHSAACTPQQDDQCGHWDGEPLLHMDVVTAGKRGGVGRWGGRATGMDSRMKANHRRGPKMSVTPNSDQAA